MTSGPTLPLQQSPMIPLHKLSKWVHTAEGFFNAGAMQGAGIWKSTDGGTSWSQLTSTTSSDFYYNQKVIVTPSGTVFTATRSGLFRSTNGGSSWTQLFTGRFADLEVASNGDIYASEGIFSAGVVRKSTNDGSSWTTVTPATGGERIELAIAPSDPNTIYAVASNNTAIAWLSKTTNGGSSWTNLNIPAYVEQSCTQSTTNDFARGQAWYDLIMTVHPTNPNIALIGGIDIYKTTNGGSSWGLVSYWTGACDVEVHADQHAMMFSPTNVNTAIFGNDGGVYYSSNIESASNPSFVARNSGYNVTQFYGADQVNSAGSDVMLAGAQDNGSHRFTSSGINSTTEVTGGDGAFCHIDQLNSNYQFTQYVYNSFYRSTNGGTSFSSLLQNQTYGRFINPTDYDDNAKVMYSAANADQYIYLDNLTGANGAFLANANLNGFQASAVKVSPYTSNRIFIGTGIAGSAGGSAVFRIDNSNSNSPTVVQISTSAIPANGYISSVELGSSDNQVLVTYSNYGVTSVWETRNGGSSWSNREGNLPDIPVRWALYNHANTNEVLLATELGVWSTDNINVSSPDWGVTNSGLANVRCDMLQYRDADGIVIVATHGRGLYSSDPFNASGGDTQAPTTPTSLASSNVGTSSFDVSWNASSDNVGVTGYSVSLNGSPVGSTASTSFSFSGLSSSTTYAVAVAATDAAGNTSAQATTSVTTSAVGISCATTISAFPYGESFEGSAGAWSQGSGDDGDWINFSGATPSSTTGPSSASDGSFYFYLEASTNGTSGQIGANATAVLDGPCIDLSSEGSASIDFDYHMYGSNMGTLILEASTNGTSWTPLWSLSGDQGNVWNTNSVDLASYLGGVVKIRFVGTTGASWQSDLAIDNISVSAGNTGGGDTQAPTTPTSLAASNITETTLDLNWSSSSDNVGVTGYNVYQGASLLGSVTGTAASITGLVASTNYTFGVSATDASGNESSQATVNTTTASPTGGCTDVTFDSESFESGWGIWNDGGSDARRSANDATYANGTYCVRLRDNTSSSTTTTDNLNLTDFEDLTVDFSYYPRSMENGEDFWLQISTNGGSTYSTVATWAANSQFVNGQRYNETVTLNSGFASANTRVRFRCDASGNSDYVYVDDIVLSGCSNGTTQAITKSNLSDEIDLAEELDNEFDLDEISLFPNPTVDFINVNYLPQGSKIEMLNISGQTILEAFDQSRFNVSALKSGIYMLKISTDDESRIIKFIKR
ncbi:MAG: chitodextrinase [Cyclobacteriaceae bacterium]|jgi:chitodextrinase